MTKSLGGRPSAAKRQAGRDAIGKRKWRPPKRELQCPMCHSPANSLRSDNKWCTVYPCGHTACDACIYALVKKHETSGLGHYPCWMCRTPFNRCRATPHCVTCV